jgi:hypothetical protein
VIGLLCMAFSFGPLAGQVRPCGAWPLGRAAFCHGSATMATPGAPRNWPGCRKPDIQAPPTLAMPQRTRTRTCDRRWTAAERKRTIARRCAVGVDDGWRRRWRSGAVGNRDRGSV